MASVRIVRDAMTLDLVIWQAFGRQDEQLVEQTLALNPGLAAAGTVLPVGLEIMLPEPPAQRRRVRDTIRLWS
ncbi:MAG: phage tail protein [Chelatococcus sp.]|nr:MAG: phage tail protein [Chelatococcus sp.]